MTEQGGRWLTSTRTGFTALLFVPFRRLWTGSLLGQLGFWVAFLALQAWMIDVSDGDGAWLGLLFFANFIPLLILTPLAGGVADRVPRRSILIWTYLLMGLLAAVLTTLSILEVESRLALVLVALGIGTGFAFMSPANQALVTATVPRAHLSSAVSMQSLASNLSRVLGPGLGGVVLAIGTASWAFGIYVLFAIFVVLTIRRVDVDERIDDEADIPFTRSLIEGFTHARRNPRILVSLVGLSLVSLTAGAYLSLLPMVSVETFDRGSSGLVTLSVVTGIGSVVGAIISGIWDRRSTFSSTMNVVALFGVSFVAFGLARTWTSALVAVSIVGLFYIWGMTALTTLIQKTAEDRYRGRVMALFVVAWGGMVPVGALWQGVVIGQAGVRATVVLCGIATVLTALGARQVGRGFDGVGAARDEPVSLRNRGAIADSVAAPVEHPKTLKLESSNSDNPSFHEVKDP